MDFGNTSPSAETGSTTTIVNLNQEEGEDNTFGLRAEDLVLLLIIVGFALSVGSLGYYYTTNLSLLDCFYTSSLILSGMGPPTKIYKPAGKFFASFYALFSGFVFIVIVTIFIDRFISRSL